jgi:hypothetical protein
VPPRAEGPAPVSRANALPPPYTPQPRVFCITWTVWAAHGRNHTGPSAAWGQQPLCKCTRGFTVPLRATHEPHRGKACTHPGVCLTRTSPASTPPPSGAFVDTRSRVFRCRQARREHRHVLSAASLERTQMHGIGHWSHRRGLTVSLQTIPPHPHSVFNPAAAPPGECWCSCDRGVREYDDPLRTWAPAVRALRTPRDSITPLCELFHQQMGVGWVPQKALLTLLASALLGHAAPTVRAASHHSRRGRPHFTCMAQSGPPWRVAWRVQSGHETYGVHARVVGLCGAGGSGAPEKRSSVRQAYVPVDAR